MDTLDGTQVYAVVVTIVALVLGAALMNERAAKGERTRIKSSVA
jgi:hypothetical protein